MLNIDVKLHPFFNIQVFSTKKLSYWINYALIIFVPVPHNSYTDLI